jgi:hypothetical protein
VSSASTAWPRSDIIERRRLATIVRQLADIAVVPQPVSAIQYW